MATIVPKKARLTSLTCVILVTIALEALGLLNQTLMMLSNHLLVAYVQQVPSAQKLHLNLNLVKVVLTTASLV